jgi:hypothetical protein
VPLLAQAEGVEALRPVDRQYAVQMIDLVLQKLRSISLYFDLVPLPF